MAHVYIFTNSPGEICDGYVYYQSLQSQQPNTIVISLTPCQYATGQERHVCQQFHWYATFMRRKIPLKSVFQMDQLNPEWYCFGDPMYAKRFTNKSSSKLIGYTERFYHKGFTIICS